MLFKDLKPNYPVYALFKEDTTKAVQGKVTSISGPRIEQIKPGQITTSQMVVDVTIELEGKTATYSIPEMLSVTYAGNKLVLSVDKEGILREVEAMKSQSEEALKNENTYKKIIEDCSAILSDWSPVFKEKKETEERLNKIENSIDKLSGLVSSLVNEFKK